MLKSEKGSFFRVCRPLRPGLETVREQTRAISIFNAKAQRRQDAKRLFP
jgi:hypothetical protein